MQTYIYDHYGYVVEEDDVNEFLYQGYHFKLEAHDKVEEELISLRELLIEIDKNLFNVGADIIFNSLHQLGSIEEGYSISLIAVKDKQASLNELYKMHRFYHESNKAYNTMSLEETRTLWEKKIDDIEENILKTLDREMEDYHKIYALIQYYLGLGENALTYLIDTIYDLGPIIDNVTIAHKRLNKLDYFELMNPFNLVLDSPMRDLGELYKNRFINNDSLLRLLSGYEMNKKEIMILFARILFPSKAFDLLESIFEGKSRIGKELINLYNDEKEKMKEIRSLHLALINNFEIRPIEWLLN